jgi:hypothetical protein
MEPALRLDANGAEQGTFHSLLTELDEVHRQLVAEMVNIDAVTRGPQPSTEGIAAARWRISQASLRRRLLFNSICGALHPIVNEQERLSLKQLQEADQAMMLRSRVHVSAWLSDGIRGDWAGYCEASRAIRWHIDAYLTVEQRILFPILERLARR